MDYIAFSCVNQLIYARNFILNIMKILFNTYDIDFNLYLCND